MSERGLTMLLCMATALSAGFVIGAEREQGGRARFGGIRTFPVFALAGAIGSLVHVGLVVALGIALAALVTVAYVRESQTGERAGDEPVGSLGISSEMAALATFALGALSTADETGLPTADRLLLVGAGATAVLALLALKRTLHALVARISREDVYATAKLLLLSVVVLPVLPSEEIGPWDALNPRAVGLLVVLISAIAFAGYVAIRVFGPERGLGLTGLLGGLASSTAVTLTFSGRARQTPELAPACSVAIVLASATMFPRVAVVLMAVSPRLVAVAVWPLAVACAVGLLFGAGLYVGATRRRDAAEPDVPLELENPFTLWSALKLAALLTLVLIASRAAQVYLADAGVLLSAAVAGIANVDAVALSAGRLHAQGVVTQDVAVHSVGLAVASNTAAKLAIASALGGAGLAARVAVSLTAAILAGGLTAWLVL